MSLLKSITRRALQDSKQTLGKERQFGIEIETVISRDLRVQRHSDVLQSLQLNADESATCSSSWHMIQDKSIDAGPSTNSLQCELVSPKLSINERTLQTLQQICQALQVNMHANVNQSCGFHVHFDAADLRMKHVVKLAINYAYFERVIDCFMHASRRKDGNRYIRSIRGPVMKNIADLQTVLSDSSGYHRSSLSVLDMINPQRKCHKYNFSNYVYYHLCKIGVNKDMAYINTIENRHHHATLDYEEMVNWIKFNMLMIHHSKHKPLMIGLQNDVRCDEDKEQPPEKHRIDPIDPIAHFDLLVDFIEDDELMSYYQKKMYMSLQ
eukprot:CAMPEP_0197034818 /NCGR_PEP_ID=MMETSP1384-20130603/12779_1 /TAXON_ID=29189 /ORGANISM="Ammonia sp." /LENGTH=323 /DNA_ID=CAMNT_0042464777 /DNA_START=123 /DNA_END=1094 /DNA_ORIENTATION=-